MMARKPSALAGIFDDQPEEPVPAPVAEPSPMLQQAALPRRSRRDANAPTQTKRSSHPGKKPVLIHIPEDMHRALRQLSVEEGGEPLTVITERLLRQYLVKRGHTRFAP
ncbi:hypothetical protein WG907_17960 [Sphingobium sp. AN558]|uniref:hypothetical protein n=1 Tax=Sphingobium sp. AN558 TaxID=3133442 RepID=UPI0030C6121A